MPSRKPRPVAAPTPEQLAALVAEFGKGFARWLQGEMHRTGTTPARARLLLALKTEGPCRMSDLSTLLDVTPRSITKLVDGLEREGLVLRQPHPQDRRAVLLSLTAQGVTVCKETCLVNTDVTTTLYAELSPADRTHFARVLERLMEALQKRQA